MMGNHDPSAPISLLLHPFLLSRWEKEAVTNLGTVADLGTTLIPLNIYSQTFYSIKCCHWRNKKGRSLKVIWFSPEILEHMLRQQSSCRLCLICNVLQYQPPRSIHVWQKEVRICRTALVLNKFWHCPHKLGWQFHSSQFHPQVHPALDNMARLHQHTAIFYNMHSEFQLRKHRQTPPSILISILT